MKRLDYRWALVVLPALAALVSPIPGSAEPAAGGQRHTTSRIEPQISAITLGVRDLEASYRFYEGGLGLPAQRTPSDGIVFFSTTGTKLFLFPYSKLAADAGVTSPDEASRSPFPGFTLGHVVRTKSEVDRVLALAVNSGGKMVKAAHETSWGGYSGYFSDPDGYLWEVLYAPNLRFAPDGTVIVPQGWADEDELTVGTIPEIPGASGEVVRQELRLYHESWRPHVRADYEFHRLD